MKISKGDVLTMMFHYGGVVSEEEVIVSRVSRKKNTVTVEEGWEFDMSNGVCLNDNKWGGARRALRLED